MEDGLLKVAYYICLQDSVARTFIGCQMSVLIARAKNDSRRNENHFSTYIAMCKGSINIQ